MGAEDDDRVARTPPGTQVDDDPAPPAMRVPPRDTDPADGPSGNSGGSGHGTPRTSRSRERPTSSNGEDDESSAPTVRRSASDAPAARPARAAPERGSEDTLLSAPAPAEGFEVDFERRLEETERRLDQIEADLARFTGLHRTPTERPLGQTPLFWIVFLLAVAVAWLFFHGRH